MEMAKLTLLFLIYYLTQSLFFKILLYKISGVVIKSSSEFPQRPFERLVLLSMVIGMGRILTRGG